MEKAIEYTLSYDAKMDMIKIDVGGRFMKVRYIESPPGIEVLNLKNYTYDFVRHIARLTQNDIPISWDDIQSKKMSEIKNSLGGLTYTIHPKKLLAPAQKAMD